MSLSFRKKYFREYWGFSSVKGGMYSRQGIENQDAVLVVKSRFGIVLVVADGVGSHKYSALGSKAAVKAVRRAFDSFEKGSIANTEITKTIFKLYVEMIDVDKRAEASTTCIFAYISNISGLYLGQIGDGMCCATINDHFLNLKKKDDDFSNLVTPLNATKESAKWYTRHFNIGEKDKLKIMLATDGISTDIIPGKENDGLEYFANKMGRIVTINNYKLRRVLKGWDPKGAGDDKTVIIYSRG